MTQLATFDSALSINPSSAQVDRFLALDPRLPVVFINLHEYHEHARYPATYTGAEPPAVSGHEAYHRYLRRVEQEYLPQVVAKFLIAWIRRAPGPSHCRPEKCPDNRADGSGAHTAA